MMYQAKKQEVMGIPSSIKRAMPFAGRSATNILTIGTLWCTLGVQLVLAQEVRQAGNSSQTVTVPTASEQIRAMPSGSSTQNPADEPAKATSKNISVPKLS